MLWICLTAWAGLFIWYFRMRKKAEDHKLVRRIFCLAATGFIAGTSSIPDISEERGFSSSRAFIEMFKKVNELTPKQYRDQCNEHKKVHHSND